MLTIYHNPRCSKSREALAILESACAEHAQELKVIDYQKTPLSVGQLTTLLEQLGGDVQQMLRNNEAEYAEKNLAEADVPARFRPSLIALSYCNVLSLHSMEERS
jgi:arsenate reductase